MRREAGSEGGTVVSRWSLDARLNYAPYFYNPPLDPEGRRLLFISDGGGTEQAYILDLEGEEATQVTDAHGEGLNWAPYICEGVAGIRPQFVAWSRPDWSGVLYWDANRLCRVDLSTLAEETVYVLPAGLVPSVPHCSAQGLVAFGWLPATAQEAMRSPAAGDMEDALHHGCGLTVVDLASRKVVGEVRTPFWPNHVSVSPDARRVLHCHEGTWRLQRMYLYDLAAGERRPLRVQDDGAAIGHEFWIDAHRVGYHGTVAARSVFGVVNVQDDTRTETPSASASRHAGHTHLSPGGQWVVTDGEETPDCISVARLGGEELQFRPICRHDWARDQDQRFHPHPHWHESGRWITFTACTTNGGAVGTAVAVAEVPEGMQG